MARFVTEGNDCERCGDRCMVIETRRRKDGTIRRRRQCRACGWRKTTVEETAVFLEPDDPRFSPRTGRKTPLFEPVLESARSIDVDAVLSAALDATVW